jgi:hypothetical protein
MRFRTRSRGGGRGWACSTLVFDESNFLAEFGAQSLLSALRSQADARVLYIGTALDALTQKDCLVWARLRERAIRGEDHSLLWMEWSTAFFDSEGNELGPDRLPAEQLDDRERWLEPTLAAPHRVSLEHLELERRSIRRGRSRSSCSASTTAPADRRRCAADQPGRLAGARRSGLEDPAGVTGLLRSRRQSRSPQVDLCRRPPRRWTVPRRARRLPAGNKTGARAASGARGGAPDARDRPRCVRVQPRGRDRGSGRAASPA